MILHAYTSHAKATHSQPGAQHLPVLGRRFGASYQQNELVAEEVPIAFQYNGISHAVMLASPMDLHDFALGFSISEGLIAGAHELHGFDEVAGELGITLELDVAASAFWRLKARRRTLAGRTGCGLCGTDSLGQVLRPLARLDTGTAAIQPPAITRAMTELNALQSLNHATGAVHAAAWCDADGEVHTLREDVGRHNAVDKLTGSLLRAGAGKQQLSCGFVVVTSRASVEMVQKVAGAGIGLLAAVSAPTTLAVRVANEVGLTLVGYARGEDMAIYTHPERLGA